MKRLLALCLAALPAGAAAQAQDPLCPDLRRAIGTMLDPAAVRPGWRQPHYAFFERCRSNRDGFRDEIACTWRLPAPEPAAAQIAARVERCLPAARRLPAQAGVDGIRLGYESYIITVSQQGSEARLKVELPEG